MSPTIAEFAVAIILILILIRIGLAIAPDIIATLEAFWKRIQCLPASC